jgi:peptide alpha-N-acetyltransferase
MKSFWKCIQIMQVSNLIFLTLLLESNAFKALILNALKKKTEAMAAIKVAISKNITNFTCWHVQGIILRGQKQYAEAKKSYLMAVRYDENNQNVMRDLSLIQAYLKDYDGFCETRRKIMLGRAGIITNWIVYYISLYLSKNYETAMEVFDSIIGQYAEDNTILKPHEISELYLFKVNMLIE